MGQMVAGVTGTQEGMTPTQMRRARLVLEPVGVLHHGDCIGADAEAHAIALDLGIHIVIHPPLIPDKRAWCPGGDRLPEKEYLDRNKDIVLASEILFAFPKGYVEELRSGTWSTVRFARAHGTPVVIVYPDGSMERV